ncbi:MAG TPA: hypothetical protein VK463_00835 [Desulfomonilaceae bacterium]|nr:hypothetical protein [Desulfomonilaceae bacterium]
MIRLPHDSFKSIYLFGMAILLSGLITGCDEANLAIDNILGRNAPVLSSAVSQAPVTMNLIPAQDKIAEPTAGSSSAEVILVQVPADAPKPAEITPSKTVAQEGKRRPRGEVAPPAAQPSAPQPAAPPPAPPQPEAAPAQPASPQPSPQAVSPTAPSPQPAVPTQAAPEPAAQPKPQPPAVAQGKRRAPGTVPVPALGVPEERHPPFFAVRDPFREPTEVLPSECPPSMPLCKFDRSQLKLVGVIQVSEGNYKGMVEDPDGRGYFITTGMQIGGATVTQVNPKGVTLHVHRTRTDALIPLPARETGEY